MSESIEPVNLASGAIVAQVSILGILFVGAFAIRRGEVNARLFEKPSYASIAWIALGLGVVTLGALAVSDAFGIAWGPVVGLAKTAGISWSTALQSMFVLDILCVTAIVFQTGGSRSSPFQALYFLIPTLAILLREPAKGLVVYLILVVTFFTIGMAKNLETRAESIPQHRFAYWFVSVSSFIVAVVIGFLTRPQ